MATMDDLRRMPGMTPEMLASLQNSHQQIVTNQQKRQSDAASAEAARQQQRSDMLTQQRQLANTNQEVSTRGQLAEGLQQVRSGANRRGLLYSGMNQAAQGGLRAGAQSEIAQGRSKINAASQDQLAGMEGEDLQNSMTRQQNQIKMNQSTFRQALEKKKQDQEMGKGIGGAIGSGLGSVASALTGGLL